MTDFERLEQLAAKKGGILKTADVLTSEISKTALARFVRERNYERISMGIYLAPDAWRDEAYLTQLRCPQVIFSHDSALYYHDLTDREPLHVTVTAKTGYNPSHLKRDGVKVYTVKAELYVQGITTIKTPFGNSVRVYDMDRTICDVVRSRNGMETQIFQDALKQYSKKKNKNLQKLMEYAAAFHIEKLIRQYMGVLLVII